MLPFVETVRGMDRVTYESGGGGHVPSAICVPDSSHVLNVRPWKRAVF